jgi:putative ABC transport system permease protein
VDYKVIGVVENFHFESFHKPIGPVLFTLKPRKSYLITKISGNNPDKTIDYIEKQWKSITGQNIMNYQIISDLYDRVYKEESQFGQTVLFFTLLAIFLACLGLFGLTAISTTQRTKEIGIRKVLGANFITLNAMLLKQYTKWVALANIIAWPTAYILMENWLQNYAYKINLGVTYFITAGIIALGISILTISYLAIRTARSNPVNSLRYE